MSEDDADVFRQHVMGVTPLEQDKHTFKANAKKSAQAKLRQKNAQGDRQAAASFAFSDVYQAHFDETGPLRYCRDDVPTYVLKQLRRGEYAPQWVLDCHGMTREQMKQELLAMLHAANKAHIACVNILHGIGGGVLKHALPNYLVQHPAVRAFHQAPLEYGGHGALLVLLEYSTEQ
ncbi:endonuclease SmrB [Alteromonas sediminis]|uniref:Ribosome rescue factor SmrB n=1 Tax=Alteromonas sediminis TaxID=2259342 RepID=A0A3N5Y4E8_9ALTE|nr:endonuclease SmrB [Alteromonas sediminis]RPJ68400.1 endonuclease SmrB [Alteromonas sediminis]